MRKVFECRRALTMNPVCPHATHIAVEDGRILAVGTKEDVAAWGDMPVDTQFKDKIFMPGFVEGHTHLMEGMLWDYHYIGYYDRRGPDGRVHKGLKTIDALIDHLKSIAAAREDKTTPIIAWGFDPIFFERRLHADDLDAVATDCPVLALHASLHIISANHYTMQQAGVDTNSNSENIRRDAAGKLTGEFLGPPGMFMALRVVDLNLFAQTSAPQTLWNFAGVCREAGVTTATDLTNPLDEPTVANLLSVTGNDDFPLRLAMAYRGENSENALSRLQELAPQQTDKLRMNFIKLVADGSIQGFSARLKWPGYFNGAPNGLWYIEPARLRELVKLYHDAGFQIHIHTNGDAATDSALDAIEAALTTTPRPDHRHTLQHCQMANYAHYKRMQALGVGVNLFSNHIYYWGDAHISTTMGPERAARLDDAGGAVAHNVPLAIHSDAPVTAVAPLFTAWCAINRLTPTGQKLGGDAQAISLDDALYAITMGAAYSLKMDDEVGSIETGKRADFAILDDDPYHVSHATLKDIRVHGTILGGTAFLNQHQHD